MVIDKNSTVYIFNGVPFTSSYTDTVYFSSESEQSAAFQSLPHMSLANYSYVKVNNTTIRVDFNNVASNESIYNCNYIMFRNTGFSTKWWYAFITNVRYINNGCYEITYEIDVIQSYMFNIDWTTPVFVEREHPILDTLFSSLTEENIPTGDYLFSSQTDLINPKNPVIVIACSVDENNEDAEGALYGNIYSGVEYNVFSVTDVTSVNNFINNLTVNNRATAIVAIFMAYDGFFGNSESGGAKTRLIGVNINISGGINGYTPRNNKLYNYPYNFLYVTDGSGNYMEIKPQYVSLQNNQIQITLAGETSCNPSITLYPMGYKGVTGMNFNEKMTLTGFPQCSYTIDSFKAWLAQNAGSLAINTLASAGTMVTGLAIPGVGTAAAVGSGVSILNSIMTLVTESAKPPQANGAMGAGGMFAHGLLTFVAYQCNITAERAEIIDDFFDKKGYATKKVKTLQRSSRPYWNYCETRECDLHGNVPDTYMRKINTIFDNGITWWKSLSYVGNYTLDNSPTQ